MNLSEIRKKYLEFYAARGHVIVPSASLVPENDATTLFTGSGMQPLVPYLLGEAHPAGKRIADSQKSFRAEDIEEVGDNRHTTFFEMLGNWSLGDYFKKEQLPWFFEFLTKEAGLDPKNLYVTVFAGDPETGIPKDEEAVAIWRNIFAEAGIEAEYVELGSEARGSEIGMQGGRIFSYDVKKNWWSRAGIPSRMPAGEPGGPDSEVFYDFGTEHDPKFGKHCHPNCDCGRFLEIGNSVFMEYRKKDDGSFEKLAQRNVDFGGGLERIAAASNGEPDVFRTDVFATMIRHLEKSTEFRYDGSDSDQAEVVRSFRIVADHVRASVFMLADGVSPSNTERGYIVRRLLRRAIRYTDYLRIEAHTLYQLAGIVAAAYADSYPGIGENLALIESKIREEEEKFRKTLNLGHKELVRLVEGRNVKEEDIKRITGSDLFFIYSTYGYPLEVSFEEIDKIILPETQKDPKRFEQSGFYDKAKIRAEFRAEFEKHQELSRTATAGTFKGGLADHSDKVIRLHTATHLMNAALRKVLGDHVWQKGSNITAERTRFDFTHPAKLTEEEKAQVESLVNEWIARDYEVKKEIMPLDEAKHLGAIGVFGEKYPDIVSVYTVWDPKSGEVVSREFCGGPHVAHTAAIGKFKIEKEEASSAGVRRVKASVE